MGRKAIMDGRRKAMTAMRIVAVPTEVADAARLSGKDAHFGFPTFTGPAGEGLPCRHCLQWIAQGEERATLFTLDPFAGLEKLPLPGPVYVHADGCARYAEEGPLPAHLMSSPRTLNAYEKGRRLVAQEYVNESSASETIERLFARPEVAYIHVRSTAAGCFTFRIERESQSKT
jgi:hypothetical protein